MKPHHGNFFTLLLLFYTILYAEDFSYKFQVDNTQPYVKEAILLTFDINQTNHDIVLLFDFDLQKSQAYTFQRVDIQEKDAYHAAQIRYTYLLYPLEAGEIEIGFRLTQKATTDESVAYSFSGDRDNVKTLETQNTDISLPPLHLQVKSLPKGTKIVGDFQIDYKIKRLKAKAFEPLPLLVTIQGNGFPPVLDSLLPEEGNFTRFTELPEIKSSASKQGTYSSVTYPMAVSHHTDFTLPKLEIQAFNPKTEKSYTLLVPSHSFTIEEVNSSLLLDTEDTPRMTDIDWTWLRHTVNYLLAFIAGFLSALFYQKGKQWSKADNHHPEQLLIEKIKQSKDAKSLLQILLAYDVKRFHKSIDTLEKTLYKKETKSLKALQQEALEIIEKSEKRQ